MDERIPLAGIAEMTEIVYKLIEAVERVGGSGTGRPCPPFFLLRGYPRERISYGSGAPPQKSIVSPFPG